MRVFKIVFYTSLILAFIIFLLPPDYTMAVYSLSILGWVWLLGLIPLTIVTFIWAGINDFNKKKWKELKIRSIVFLVVIIVSVGYWFYVAYKNGNL